MEREEWEKHEDQIKERARQIRLPGAMAVWCFIGQLRLPSRGREGELVERGRVHK